MTLNLLKFKGSTIKATYLILPILFRASAAPVVSDYTAFTIDAWVRRYSADDVATTSVDTFVFRIRSYTYGT